MDCTVPSRCYKAHCKLQLLIERQRAPEERNNSLSCSRADGSDSVGYEMGEKTEKREREIEDVGIEGQRVWMRVSGG